MESSLVEDDSDHFELSQRNFDPLNENAKATK